MNKMEFYIKSSEQHLEFFFNANFTQSTFHTFHRHKHLTIFNIPKCASTSLAKYFDHTSNHYKGTPINVSFVRNPIERLASAFKMKCKNEYGTASVREIIEKYQRFLMGETVPRAHYNDMIHFVPQSDFIRSSGLEFDFVFKVENLQESIDFLSRFLKIDHYKIEQSNKTNFTKADLEEFQKQFTRAYSENKDFYDRFLLADNYLYQNANDKNYL